MHYSIRRCHIILSRCKRQRRNNEQQFLCEAARICSCRRGVGLLKASLRFFPGSASANQLGKRNDSGVLNEVMVWITPLQDGQVQYMDGNSESLLIPPEFYFQTAFEIPFQRDLESMILNGKHPDISVPLPNLIFAPSEDQQVGTVRVAWNDGGVAVSAEASIVPPKKDALSGNTKQSQKTPARPEIVFYIDTRDMKSNRRANRFCHCFQIVFPVAKGEKILPGVTSQIPLVHSQSRKLSESEADFPTVGSVGSEMASVSCWLPKKVLTGFDPENVPSIGFFYILRYQRHPGTSQTYGLSEDFPYPTDSSLWPSLKLSR